MKQVSTSLINESYHKTDFESPFVDSFWRVIAVYESVIKLFKETYVFFSLSLFLKRAIKS